MSALRKVSPAYYVKKTGLKGILPFFFVTLLAIFMLPYLKIDTTPYLKPPAGDRYFSKIESMKKSFTPAVFIMLSAEAEDPFSREEIIKVKNLTGRLSGLKGIGSLASLTTLEDIVADSHSIQFIPLSEGEITEKEIRVMEENVRRTPLFSKLFLSQDAKAWSILVFPENPENGTLLSGKILEILKEDEFRDVQAFGYPILSYYTKYSTLKDFFLLTMLSLIIVLIIEILICKNMKTGIILWLSSILPALWTMALFAIFGQDMRAVSIMTPILTLALSTSYSIHLYRYYCSHPSLNLVESLNGASPIIGITGFTTMLGFATLLFSPVVQLRVSGIFIVAGIFFAMISALYMLPVLLRIISMKRSTREGFNPVLALKTQSKTVIQITLLIILIVGGVGFLRIHSDYRIEKMFHSGHPIVKSTDYFNNTFSGIEEIEVLFDTNQEYGLINLDTYMGIKRVTDEISSLAQVNLVISYIDFVEWANGRFAGDLNPVPPQSEEEIGEMMEILYGGNSGITISTLSDISYSKARLLIRYGYKSRSPDAYVSTLRSFKQQIATSFNTHLPGATYEIAGQPIEQQEIAARLVKSSLMGILIFFPVLFILLSLVFRSLKQAVLPLISVISGVIVYFGAMGWMGFAFNAVFSFMVAATIGVGVDDAIYFVLFFRQQQRKDIPSGRALAVTIRKTGTAIIQTTLIIDAGLLVLLFSSYRSVTQSGILVILSLSFSTLVTLLIIPSLLGRITKDVK